MARRFDSFVILAEMRTGSNFLEASLNSIAGVKCWGEAFNPQFIGHAGQDKMAGVTLAARRRNPARLIDAIQAQTDGLAGFRFFHDHDPRVLDWCLENPRCAKVVLSRNMLDSYISLKIARTTGQWRLGDVKNAKSARIRFEPAEFLAHLVERLDFRDRVSRQLQLDGQTAFHLDYGDLRDVAVLNGLARFLGVAGRLQAVATETKVQNPGDLSDKVSNIDELRASLAQLDPFDLDRLPGLSQRLGPNVGSYAANGSGVLFMPIPGCPDQEIRDWLSAVDGTPIDALTRFGSQKELRAWMRPRPAARAFSVLRDPAQRLVALYDQLARGRAEERLTDVLKSELGALDPLNRRVFFAFADYVKANLRGQTGLPPQRQWSAQSVILAGFAQFRPADMLIREGQLESGLKALAGQIGRSPAAPGPADPPAILPDDSIRTIAREIYPRDMLLFGP